MLIVSGDLSHRLRKEGPYGFCEEGPFGVGYGICSFCGAAKDPYVVLARKSLETYIRTGEAMEAPEGLPEEMLKNRNGTFVSLKEGGRIRGCIGTIQGVQTCIAREIIKNAISAESMTPSFLR